MQYCEVLKCGCVIGDIYTQTLFVVKFEKKYATIHVQLRTIERKKDNERLQLYIHSPLPVSIVKRTNERKYLNHKMMMIKFNDHEHVFGSMTLYSVRESAMKEYLRTMLEQKSV